MQNQKQLNPTGKRTTHINHCPDLEVVITERREELSVGGPTGQLAKETGADYSTIAGAYIWMRWLVGVRRFRD